MVKQKLICQGAEARIILAEKTIIKDRIKKSYRIPELDKKIRISRTKLEKKLLKKASKVINCPSIIESKEEDPMKIKMQYLKGKKLSEHLENLSPKEQKEVCKKIGEAIAKLHDSSIIHGDLTTSNMILVDKKVYFIDFGLGFISARYEDKAVDLHLLKQALEAKHFKKWETLFKAVLKGYSKSKTFKQVLQRLKIVEKRGRYKSKT